MFLVIWSERAYFLSDAKKLLLVFCLEIRNRIGKKCRASIGLSHFNGWRGCWLVLLLRMGRLSPRKLILNAISCCLLHLFLHCAAYSVLNQPATWLPPLTYLYGFLHLYCSHRHLHHQSWWNPKESWVSVLIEKHE